MAGVDAKPMPASGTVVQKSPAKAADEREGTMVWRMAIIAAGVILILGTLIFGTAFNGTKRLFPASGSPHDSPVKASGPLVVNK